MDNNVALNSGTIFDKALNISIFNDKAIISYYHDKILKHRTIKLEALLESFLSTNIVHKSPILSDNIIRYIKNGNVETFILFYPPEEKTIKYNNGTSIQSFENVKLPSRIWVCTFKSDVYFDSKSYFCDEPSRFQITEDTRLYKNIFPNVYSDCKICWGHNGHKAFNKPILANAIDYTFFNSEFNNDLANIENYRRANIENGVPGLFAYLKSSEEFPKNLFIDSAVTMRSIGS